MSTEQPAAETATAFGLRIVGPAQPQHLCEQAWQRYCTAWTAIPTQQRQQLLEQSVTPTIHYTDKLTDSTGYDTLTRHIELFQTHATGASFITKQLSLHHRYGRAEYTCVDAGGKAVLDGVDFIEFADDGRICNIVGFY